MISDEQSDEILALSSIFGEDFVQTEYEDGTVIYQVKVKVHLVGKNIQINAWLRVDEDEDDNRDDHLSDGNNCVSPGKKIRFQRSKSKRHTCLILAVSHLPPLCLEFSFPRDYPISSKPLFVLSCLWLDCYHLRCLCEKLDELWEINFKGEPVIYPWLDWLQNSSLEFLNAGSVLSLKPYVSIESNNENLKTYQDPRGVWEFLDPKACALKILEYNFKIEQEEFRKASHTCEICFEEREGIFFHFLVDCGHKFCVECLLDYCHLHVNEGTVKMLKCPQNKCPEMLTPMIIWELLSDKDFARWEQLLFLQTLDGMADVFYCPRCNAAVILDEDESSRLAQCPNCYFFCAECLMTWHSSHNCGDENPTPRQREVNKKSKRKKLKRYLNSSAGSIIEDFVSDTHTAIKATKQSFAFFLLQKQLGKYQRCPKCRIMIEKTAGCDFMVCSRCGQQFCFRCGCRESGKQHFQHCLQPTERDEDRVVLRGQAMLDGRPVAPAAMLINEMQRAKPRARLKLRPCPRCRQKNMKEHRNNHIKCWSCKADFCYMCKKIVGNPISAHFTSSTTCQQHSDD